MVTKGQRINNRYEIIKLIGEGGMANVYLAKDIILNRDVAVKILRGDLADDEKFVRRFQREALSASSLCHPNIVEMYDVGEDNGYFYIVMEYIEGVTLKQLVKRRKYLNLNEVLDIMLQLTDALAHAHESYIIHRDIKPQNILILYNGLVKITDFGIAMAMNNSQMTQTNSVMGSVHYLPPEQASGKGSTIKSDIYSLGIMMYELLTGKLPFTGDNAVEIALKHLKEKIPCITHEMDNIPQSIENIILKACAKNPKNRYNNSREMYDDLKQALNDEHKNDKIIEYIHPEEEIEESKKEEVKEDTDKIKVEKIEEKKPRKKLLFIIISLVTFLMVLALIFFMLLPKLLEEEDIKIPDVKNMTVLDAEQLLEAEGLIVANDTQKIYSDEIELEKVIKTSPAIGRTVKKGSLITIYESLGSEKIVIEDYTGENIYEVKARLELLGLKVDIDSENVDDITLYKGRENEIINQEPKEGNLSKGNQIILYYPNVVVYPDMTGWLLEDVEEFAGQYELNLTILESETSEFTSGTVIDQNRKEGVLVVRKAQFIITIAVPISEEE